jgi:hypothetical protein
MQVAEEGPVDPVNGFIEIFMPTSNIKNGTKTMAPITHSSFTNVAPDIKSWFQNCLKSGFPVFHKRSEPEQ